MRLDMYYLIKHLLKYHTKEEMVQILKKHYEQHQAPPPTKSSANLSKSQKSTVNNGSSFNENGTSTNQHSVIKRAVTGSAAFFQSMHVPGKAE